MPRGRPPRERQSLVYSVVTNPEPKGLFIYVMIFIVQNSKSPNILDIGMVDWVLKEVKYMDRKTGESDVKSGR